MAIIEVKISAKSTGTRSRSTTSRSPCSAARSSDPTGRARPPRSSRSPDCAGGRRHRRGAGPHPGRSGAAPPGRGAAAGERAAGEDVRTGGARAVRPFYPQPADWRTLAGALGLDDKLRTRCHALSGGQKQRLSIALALIGRPRVAILDELTTGLDPQARRDTWDLIESIRDRGVTVLLVTHFMAEAERLCDRAAVIDAGRVVALNTPRDLIAGVAVEQRIRFRPSAELDDRLLTDLPDVRRVQRHGPTVEVVGVGDVLQAVTAVLATHGIIAADLRVEQAGLDDAFVRLTGRRPASRSASASWRLRLIARGGTNREAAAKLFISEATVKTHLLHLYAKLGVRDRAAAVATAFERGLLGGD